MRHPRLVAVVIGLVLLGLPIGVGMHHRGVLTGDANLAAGTTAQHTYTSWKGAAGFAAGTHEGTTVVDGELVMGTPVGTTYARRQVLADVALDLCLGNPRRTRSPSWCRRGTPPRRPAP